jgi:hypothetical protein
LYATVVWVDASGLRIRPSQPENPCACRFSVVGWRTASRRPVMRKTATPFFLARLKRSSVGLIATPILLTASAWELGPKVKLSALIAE